MSRFARLLPLVLAACLALPAGLAAQGSPASPTVVFVVRHGEKAATPGPDPELSEAGRARAAALAEALAGAGVEAVVTTQFRRTGLTAAPLASARGLVPEVVAAGGAGDAHARAVADAVRRHAGKTVLVVGHSNTVSAIVAALGGPKGAELCDSEYSNLFTVVLRPEGAPAVARSRYGAADPPADPACGRSMRQE